MTDILPVYDPYLQLVICLAFSFLLLTVVLGLPLWRPWRCGILCISNCVSRYTLLVLFTLRMGSCIKMLQNVTFLIFWFFFNLDQFISNELENYNFFSSVLCLTTSGFQFYFRLKTFFDVFSSLAFSSYAFCISRFYFTFGFLPYNFFISNFLSYKKL